VTRAHVFAGALVVACSSGPPPPPELATDPATVERGRALFVDHCALCHGVRGDGNGPRREGILPPPADLTSAGWRRGADPRRVHDIIRDGKPGTSMPSWHALDEADIWALVAYVLSLGGRP
jgi:mono/diheme cytochrome c family protein